MTEDKVRAAIRDAIADMRRERESGATFRPTTITGEMAIAVLYLREQIGSGVRVVCGVKFLAEIRRLERMTLAERIAEKDAR